jgi:glyceraldehyde 3-phosphate dehydrogenase
MKTRVAINGLGRIGRAFLKVAIERPELEVVAVNDLGDIHNLAYLLKYDTAYGVSKFSVEVLEGKLIVNGKILSFFSETDPLKLPWGDLNIDVVVESTGVFTEYSKANLHRKAGAKRVVISAPGKGTPEDGVTGSTVLMAINDDALGTCDISSNGSCTTNAVSPVVAILDQAIGIEKAILNTVHAYTASQSIVDGPNKKDFREGRAAAQNMIPASTGAAKAVTEALTGLQGKFDGIAIRVPVIAGSIADVTFISKRNTTVEEVNKILKDASMDSRWARVFSVTEEPLVSSDILGSPHASIVDLALTRVVDGNLVKVLAWYDNEMGYTHTLVDHVIKMGKNI